MKHGTVLGNAHRCVCLYVICLCMYRGVCACMVTAVAGQSRRYLPVAVTLVHTHKTFPYFVLSVTTVGKRLDQTVPPSSAEDKMETQGARGQCVFQSLLGAFSLNQILIPISQTWVLLP